MPQSSVIKHETKPWSMRLLGSDPPEEAALLRQLCERAKVDQGVVREFGSTLDKYTDIDLEAGEARVRELYSGVDADRLAAVIFDRTIPVGMAAFGRADYETTEGLSGDGLNLGNWLLEEHRGIGLGTWAMRTLGKIVWGRRHDPDDVLYKLPQWTSIRTGNLPSERMLHASDAVITFVGEDAMHPGYRIYTLTREQEDLPDGHK